MVTTCRSPAVRAAPPTPSRGAVRATAVVLALVALLSGVMMPWAWHSVHAFCVETPPWWWAAVLALVMAGSGTWGLAALAPAAPPVAASPPAVPLLPADLLAILQRVADLVPASVLIVNAELQLCTTNDWARRALPHLLDHAEARPHVLDLAATDPRMAALVALVDRLAIAPQQSIYQHGMTIVKLAATTGPVGYWMMIDADLPAGT